ncbi:MAG TPA: hypothetical protein VN610_09920 [Bryobacteraceae bacterium]|nr:hypothetical protein [Bryobacteraceae bacterium]
MLAGLGVQLGQAASWEWMAARLWHCTAEALGMSMAASANVGFAWNARRTCRLGWAGRELRSAARVLGGQCESKLGFAWKLAGLRVEVAQAASGEVPPKPLALPGIPQPGRDVKLAVAGATLSGRRCLSASLRRRYGGRGGWDAKKKVRI